MISNESNMKVFVFQRRRCSPEVIRYAKKLYKLGFCPSAIMAETGLSRGMVYYHTSPNGKTSRSKSSKAFYEKNPEYRKKVMRKYYEKNKLYLNSRSKYYYNLRKKLSVDKIS